ncbi:MAG: putative porin [Raineya sp.]|nr:putative porin [Raineya sp.]MDW8297081.1 putative porin [Raineya sp.]
MNDTTENVYGFATTLRITEYQVFRRQDTALQKLDSSLVNFHRFSLVRKNRFLYQDLGHNLGTPTKPIFYELPTQAGVQWGIKSYEAHKIHPDSVYYYDTKSPYSDFFFVQGGRGQQIAGVEFTRNITERSNFGFVFQRTNTFRQYALSPNRTENAILEQYRALAWVRYFSRNKRYQILAHYHHLNSPLKELGGVKNGDSLAILYNYTQTEAQLVGEPRSWQIYDRFRLYHEYNLDSTRHFAFFQISQFEKQRDSYFDGSFETNQVFYLGNAFPTFPVDLPIKLNEVNDNYQFRLLTNQVGIRTAWKGQGLWAYLKRRDLGVKSNFGEFYRIRNIAENYLGGILQTTLPFKANLEVQAEYLLGKQDYLLQGRLSQKFLQASLKSISFSPAIIENRYFSRIRSWDYQNNLRNTFAQEIWGELSLPFPKFTLKPSLRYQILTNYIFFNRDTTGYIYPDQLLGTLQISQIGLQFNFQVGDFYFENQAYYTKNLTNFDVIRFPEWHLWGSWYYEKGLFRNALLLRAGIDWHWRSAYFADAYMPALKQFYLQNEFLVRAYPVSDLFVSFRIRKVRAFLKITHWNEGILPAPDNGYVVTPFYAGFRRTFGLGISWRLFD